MNEATTHTFHPAPAGWRAGCIRDGTRPDDIRHVIGWLVSITPPVDEWGEHDPDKDPHIYAVAVVDDSGAGTAVSADYWLAPGEELED